MPLQRMNVCSFWVHRPQEHPAAADYPRMLKILQRTCDNLGLRHVVLTDFLTAASVDRLGIESYSSLLPSPLMQAVTQAQANWLSDAHWRFNDTLMIGADCLMLRHPDKVFPLDADLCVTLRPGHERYPINTGAILVRARRRDRAAGLFREIAAECGPKWGDDQRTIARLLAPLPMRHGTWERQGLKTCFLPMPIFNHSTYSAHDPADRACVLHFRGKGRKPYIFEWAERHLNEDGSRKRA